MPATKVSLIVPQIDFPFKSGDYNYSTASVKAANVALLKSIKSNYGNYIEKYSTLFGIPATLIAAFIATESGGKNVGPNKYDATGLMQITPNAFYEALSRSVRVQSISDNELAFVRGHISGINISIGKNMPLLSANIKSKLLEKFEISSEFNIFSGCLYMNFLIDRFAINGDAQINKVLVGYNAGPYLKILAANIGIALNTGEMAKNPIIPKESRAYLVKMLGIDGYVDLCIRQKLVTFNS
jgi:hypothetical protein